MMDFYVDASINYFDTMASLFKMLRMVLPFLGHYQWTHKTAKKSSSLLGALSQKPTARPVTPNTSKPLLSVQELRPIKSFETQQLDFLDELTPSMETSRQVIDASSDSESEHSIHASPREAEQLSQELIGRDHEEKFINDV
jgi:hypothetical protein